MIRRIPAGGFAALADQCLLSAGTLLVVVVSARHLASRDVGLLAIFQAIVALVLLVNRAIVSDTWVLMDAEDAKAHFPAALSAGITMGFLGTPAFAVASAMNGSVTGPWILWALSLPLITVVDVLRVTGVRRRAVGRSLAADSLGFAVMVAIAVLLPQDVIVAWPVGMALAALLLLFAARTRPNFTGFAWMKTHWRRYRALLIEMLIGSGLQQVMVFLLAAIASTSVTGTIRVGQTLLGPMTLPLIAASPFVLGYFARRAENGLEVRQSGRKVALLIAALTAIASLALVLALHVEIWGGVSVGAKLLGVEAWMRVAPLLAFLAVPVCLNSATLVIGAVARVQNQTGRVNRLRLSILPVQVGGFVLLSYVGGAWGASLAFAVTAALTLGAYALIGMRRSLEFSNRSCGNPGDHYVGRDTSSHNGASSDDRPGADRDARQY